MYTVNHRQHRHKIFLRFLFFVLPFLLALAALIWFLFFRSTDTSTSFSNPGAKVAVVEPNTKDFTNEYFKITLPTTWVDLGRKNPFSYEVYYEYQNQQENYTNQWLRVYVDVIPDFQAITRLLPVTVVNNRFVSGTMSSECRTFTGAPSQIDNQASNQSWEAKWQDVVFICDMDLIENFTGTASAEEGYRVTLVNKNGVAHKYFIAYIDHNIHPSYQTYINAVRSFETL